MTTAVTVKVPESAAWDVGITFEDFIGEGDKRRLFRTTTEFLVPGQSCEYHITDSRSIVRIVELRHSSS